MSLVEKVIGVLVAAVVIGAVAIPVAIDALVVNTATTTNEIISSSGTVPETITATSFEDGVVDDTFVIYANDTDSGTTSLLTETTNYTVLSHDDGQVNITSAPGVNSTSDEYYVSYDYKPEGYIDSSISRSIVVYVPLAMALGLFVGAISIVA